MTMKKGILFLAVFFFVISNVNAQGFFKNTTWTFGLSGHIVVDGGKETSLPFDTKAWNFTPYPSRAFVEAYYKKGWSFTAELSYNQYKSGNVVDAVTITKNGTYAGADFNTRLAFSHFAKKEGWFDPYATIGFGYTYRDNAVNVHTGNNNIGLGVNFWIAQGFGLNLQALDKFVMKGGSKSNYTHYSVAIVYKLLSKKRNLGDK